MKNGTGGLRFVGTRIECLSHIGLNIALQGGLEELEVFVCICSYILLEDEAGQQGGGLFRSQIVEEAVENHLRQHELVTTGEIHKE